MRRRIDNVIFLIQAEMRDFNGKTPQIGDLPVPLHGTIDEDEEPLRVVAVLENFVVLSSQDGRKRKKIPAESLEQYILMRGDD